MTDQSEPRNPFVSIEPPATTTGARRRAGFDTPMTLNDAGAWVIAIPEPQRWRFYQQCPGTPNQRCHRHFWTREAYRGHYALAHILGTP